MQPSDYTGKEWTELMKELTPRQLRNSLKRSYRAVSKQALGIARKRLRTSGLHVQGNKADWEKGIRVHIYSRGGGFLITTKARAASRKTGKGEKSMHKNRRGFSKPILMWAEEGTQPRKTRSASKWAVRMRKGHKTGRMRDYGFLEKATPDMYSTLETGLFPELEKSVVKVAKKCGFV